MKKGLKILVLCCVCIGVGLGFGLGSKKFIGEELEDKFKSKENKEKNISNKDIKSDKSIQKKESLSTEGKIEKAKQSILQQCGNEFSEVVYAGEGSHFNQGGDYYIFNIGEDVTGDMLFYVDKNTYQVYEYSTDGYFGEYRNKGENVEASNVFTYDMAVLKLDNELGWDADRIFTLVEEKDDGYIIKTSFYAPGGTGTGDTFYVTRDSVDGIQY